MKLTELKEQGKAPEWMNEESLHTLQKGYLLPNETPYDMYRRIAKATDKGLGYPGLSGQFFDLMWNNWLCPSTPVASNMGTERGLPISCYGSFIPDSVDGIFNFYHEAAMLTKNGGGIGSYWSSIRARGQDIKGNGKSEGVVPWLAILDRTALAVGQGGVRRAGIQATLDIEHGDFEEFLQIRKPLGDVNRQCLNLHQAINVSDDFMRSLNEGNTRNRNKWTELLKTRVETGEPYIMFSDTANNNSPKQFQGKTIYGTQLCSEIFLPNDKDHTYVCCLSSMNLARYDEWSDWKCPKTGLTAIELSIYFLDGVMQEFIDKARLLPGFEKAVRFSEKSRALGLGVLGYHSLLQSKGYIFDSFDSMMLNAKIFKQLHVESESATTKLATLLGEPEWVKGFNRRNLTCLAIAPTMSNSIISGGMSAGIEPISSNCYSLKSAKGTFIRKNPLLVQKLEEVGQNTVDVWDIIIKDGGSIQNLPDKVLSASDKEIFKTARELNQFAIVKQAGQRQKWIDQGQSVNLFFTSDSSPRYIHEVHMMAWEEKLKSLYYLRSESVLRSHKTIEYSKSDCASCEG